VWYRFISAGLRVVVLIYAAASVCISLIVLTELQHLAEIFIQDVLGKDTTLTGRTFLWERAAHLIKERPVLGRGFQAFWRQESIEAEALWRYFQITGRGGFHFHNTYVQTTVDLGYLGFYVIIFVITLVLISLGIWYIKDISLVPSAFVALMILLTIRSFVEVDITFQFQLGTVVFYAMGYYALVHSRGMPLSKHRA
jgi:exopolysaccharide production protein ExoQ